jgi:hypothetical protein
MTLGAVLLMTAILLVPALVNGFVFTDIDSMSYLSTGLVREIPENRPVFYSLFTAALTWGISPWPVAIAQCALVAIGIWHVARVLFDVTDERALIAIAILLTAASALPWYASYMTPDIFTAVLIVATMVAGFRWERLNLVERGIYLLLISGSVSFHYGNILIALGANLVFVVLALLGWRTEGRARARFIAMNIATLMGVAVMFAATTYDHGKPALSPSGSSFYLARLLDDGSALKVLNEDCEAEPAKWRLCRELPALNAYSETHRAGLEEAQMSVADFFLWRGALQRLGGFENVEPEASKVVWQAWQRYPLEQAGATLSNGFSQFGQFWIGNLFDSWGETEPYPTLVRIFSPGVGQQHLDSMQQKGELDFTLFNIAAYLLLAASVVFLAYASWRTWKGERFWLYVALALLLFLLGNAFVMGALSGVFARYQARIIWLVPLFAMLVSTRLYWDLPRKALSASTPGSE